MAKELEISLQAFETRRRSGEQFAIIDVREPEEYVLAHLEGSQLIPMQEVPASLQKLELLADQQTLAILCHHGVRSLNVAAWLQQHGIENCFSLSGGIDRWSVEIDPTIPRY